MNYKNILRDEYKSINFMFNKFDNDIISDYMKPNLQNVFDKIENILISGDENLYKLFISLRARFLINNPILKWVA